MVQLTKTDTAGSVMSSSSSQFPSLYQQQTQSNALGMGSLQNLPRTSLSQPISRGGGAGLGGFPGQGLGDRLTPTHFGTSTTTPSRQSTMGMSLLATSTAASRNPLFSRKMGEGATSGTPGPNTFDPSEFPSLAPGASGSGAGMAGRPNYVGMVKQPTDHASDFQISNEDFPALPGAPVSDPSVGLGSNVSSLLESSKLGNSQMTSDQQELAKTQARKGIQTSPDGLVTNIPANMVVDQFGMIGLLTFIRAAETDPNLVSLALGADLTTLGLNLNSEVNLFPTFGGPWAETPCRPQDIDFHVPHEYLTNTAIREKLAPVKLNRYKDDILFYMFYTNVGDVLQLAAAAELYNRDWRYHKEERVWITRAPGMAPSEKTTTYERGTYYFFDVVNWRKVPKEFHLDYDKLEDRPSLPSSLTGTGPSPANSHPGTGSPGPVPPSQQGAPGL